MSGKVIRYIIGFAIGLFVGITGWLWIVYTLGARGITIGVKF